MNPRRVLLVILAVWLPIAAWSKVALPATACSSSTGKGTFGFISEGLDGSGNPTTNIGQIKLNGAGKSSGSLIQSDDGTITTISFTGAYTINGNCTGTGSLTSGGKSTTFAFVFDSSATHIDTVGTDAGRVSSGQGFAQGSPTCTLAGMQGTYGFRGAGALVGTGAVAFAGQYVLDGTGKLTGNETISTAGTITTQAISGTYTMASTCKGKLSYMLNGKSSAWSTVVVNGGKNVLAIETNSGSTATSELTLQ